MDFELLNVGLKCLCPRCRQAGIFQSGLTLSLKAACPQCGLDLNKNDSADGPAVFLIFVLGFALVPMALLLEFWASPPLWVHAVLWTGVALVLTLGALKPLKAYIIALQFKHSPQDWR